MPAHRLPGGRVIFLPAHIGDTVINLGDYPDIDTGISQESVPVIGDWQDYTGSGTKNKNEVMMAGLAKEQDVQMIPDNAGVGDYDERGKRTTTHRSRSKLITIE